MHSYAQNLFFFFSNQLPMITLRRYQRKL